MTHVDPVMVRYGEAVDLKQSGESGAAQSILEDLWDEVGEDGNPLHRCAIAHQLADMQPNVEAELQWDRLALHIANAISDSHLDDAGVTSGVEGLYPSLHLNLADAYRRAGDDDSAMKHVALGLDHVDALGDDGYGRMIASALRRLSDELGV